MAIRKGESMYPSTLNDSFFSVRVNVEVMILSIKGG